MAQNSTEDLNALLRKYSSGTSDLEAYFTELYACLMTLEKLEQAYAKGNIKTKAEVQEYEEECTSLITQCRLNHDGVARIFPDIEQFARAYQIPCRAALSRYKKKVPVTLEEGIAGAGSTTESVAAKLIAATEAMITLLDVLQLGGVLEWGDFSDSFNHCLDCLRSVEGGGSQIRGWDVLVAWASQLGGLKASDILGEEDKKQLKMDVEAVYREYKKKFNVK